MFIDFTTFAPPQNLRATFSSLNRLGGIKITQSQLLIIEKLEHFHKNSAGKIEFKIHKEIEVSPPHTK